MQTGGTKSRGKGSGPQVQRIADPLLREAVYNRRKNALFRRATEMSNMCDCEVAVIMFTPDGELAQFSTSSMEDMLRRYSRTCTELHETQTREGMNKRAAATAAANGSGGGAANIGGPAKKRMKEEGKDAGGRGSGRNTDDITSNDSDTAEAILSMQGLPPLAPAPELPSQDLDREFNKLIEERAKRAQQAANAGGQALARNPSGSASEHDAAATAEAGPGPSSAFLAAAAGVAAAPASAIDSLADLLKGGDPILPSALKKEDSQARNKGDPNGSPNHAAPTADVDTPTVAPYPPVAGTVELPSMLGPVAAGGNAGCVSDADQAAAE